MHDRRTQPPHEPEAQLEIPHDARVVDVLHHRESRPHREAQDAGVHEESDVRRADEVDHVDRLDDFLEERTPIAPQEGWIGPTGEKEGVEEEGDAGGQNARTERQGDRAPGDELVAVHEDQRGQEQKNRDEADDEGQDTHSRVFTGS